MALSWMMYVRNYRSFQHAKPVQILKERLVDPLPAGSTLVVGVAVVANTCTTVLKKYSNQAILDTCHSETLLGEADPL